MSSSTTVLRISFALALLSATLILLASALGFMPNEEEAERNARASIAESLAVQVISEVSRKDLVDLKKTVKTVVSRNKAIHSIAVRKATGTIVAQAGDHQKHWVPVNNGISTPTHVYVPINNGKVFWGSLEISFKPLQHGVKLFGIPIGIAILAGFLGLTGLAGNYFVLKRALRELDPSRVVPERVQKAFDTLAEGVLILDDRGLILLSNASFAKELNETAKVLIGTQAADLPWHQRNAAQSELPWVLALRDAKPIVGVSMDMKTHSGEVKKFTVNATRISDTEGAATGVIVTFDDITELELKNGELNQLVTQLKDKEVEVNLKNRELHHLATRDPLTNCMNRRAFFDAFRRGIEHARKTNTPVYCMMMDLDHFKNVNDQYGHGVGDEVIILMGDILKSACRETDVAGRYGGEEFCLALFGLTQEHCVQVAERIRLAITARATEISVLERPITTSIGIVKMADGVFDPNELLARADKALYAAKTSGRNRVVQWEELSEDGSLQNLEQQEIGISEQVMDITPPLTTSNSEVHQTPETQPVAPLEKNEIVQVSANLAAMPFVESSKGVSVEKLFLDRVTNSMARANRNDNIVAVMFVNVAPEQPFQGQRADAAYKELNRVMRTRMTGLLRKSDSVSLLSGDDEGSAVTSLSHQTFAVQVTDIVGIDPVIWIIKRLMDSTSVPISIDKQTIDVCCQIGISLYPGDGEDAKVLFEHARAASSYAQEHIAPNGHFFYSKEMNTHANRQLAIAQALRSGLTKGDLNLVYQPIMNLGTGKITGLEAFLRCSAEELRDVPTSMLISIAEQSGMIAQIGEWSFTQAIAQFQYWTGEGIVLEKIAVNLSNVQLSNPETSERLCEIMSKMDFDPAKMQLEIKESTLNENFTNARKSLRAMQQAGVQIALDDFGSGNSSLTNIVHLGPDYIKIDGRCIQDIVDEKSDIGLIAAIISMSHALELKVIAEGVETEIQLDRLVELGCDYAQGHYISMPMEPGRLIDWLKLFTKTDRRKWNVSSLSKTLGL